MKIFIGLLFSLGISTLTYSQCFTPSSVISSAYAQNNGQRGVMFDLIATNAVTILCFDFNLYAGTTSTYEIYYKSGSFIGSESNSAAWTFVGSTTGLASLGANTPTPIPIMVNVNIPAGQTCGFYVTNTSGGGVSYTDGTANNTLLAWDANLTMRGGVGKSYPFGLTFNYRNANAHVRYVPYNPLPVGIESFFATPRNQKVELSWTTNSEVNNDYFTIERSADLNIWEVAGTLKGAGNSQSPLTYSLIDERALTGTSYYRLSQNDFDGKTTYYDVRAVNTTVETSRDLIVSPNPVKDKLEIALSNDEMGNVSLYDLLGKEYTDFIHTVYENGVLTIDIRGIQSGSYILQCGNRSAMIMKH